MHRSLVASIGALSLVLPCAPAQTTPAPSLPSHAAVLKAFAVRAGTIQTLRLPANDRSAFNVRVTIGGNSYVLDLRPSSVRAIGFRVLVDDGRSLQPVQAPAENTYQGTVFGLPKSRVAASLRDGGIEAYVSVDGAGWMIEPLTEAFASAPKASHIVYRVADVVSSLPPCGVGRLARDVLSGGTKAGPLGAPKNVQLAIDADNLYYKQNGSSTAKTTDHITGILNAVDVVYRRDLNLCLTITQVIIRTSKVYTKILTCKGNDLLDEMTARWKANHSGVKRDLAHMFSGNKSNSAGGCAGVGVVCSQTSGFGVSTTTAPNAADNLVIVAHEVGHQCGANHCDNSANKCFIMCSSGVGGCGTKDVKFGLDSQKSIAAHIATRTCLSACPPPCSQSSYGFSGAGCAGTGSGSGPACVQKNWNTTLSGTFFPQKNLYALEANTGARPRSFVSLDFYCKAATAYGLPVSIYTATATGLPGSKIAGATMNVGTSAGTYTATFSPPISVAANTKFFVVFENPSSPVFTPPIATSGADVPHFIFASGAWRPGFFKNKWNYRLNCAGAKAVPGLAVIGGPRLGGSYKISVFAAKTGALAILFNSLTSGSIDLKAFGAPGCSLLVGNAFQIQAAKTDGSGVGTFTQTIPNLPQFCGAKFFQQILVVDPAANALQFVFTRRGEPKLGNL